jgi:GNAT superfamily N-acetyltransferase
MAQSVCEWIKDDFSITTDPKAVDPETVYNLLATSYWATFRSRADVEACLEHSVCFTLRQEHEQIGFARIVTDYRVFAWFTDIIVDPAYRGQKLGTWLVECMMEYPGIRTCKKVLQTRDSHGLYEKFGFARCEAMECSPLSDDLLGG